MPLSGPATQLVPATLEALATQFFQDSAGDWHSQRRYYSLDDGETQEVTSLLTVRFVTADSPELAQLAALHHLDPAEAFVCGSQVTWESTYVGSAKKPLTGSTLFGVRGNVLYRDRGFATSKPVTATFYFPNPRTMGLHTEYNNSSFDEELKLIGKQYRTRQTIIARAGQAQAIGQYLEKRLCCWD